MNKKALIYAIGIAIVVYLVLIANQDHLFIISDSPHEMNDEGVPCKAGSSQQ